ncbi:MAG: hypothetical protein U0166_06555 [Acidobacteriota bacterium]
MSGSIGRALHLLREPIHPEKKRLMKERWDELDPRWQLPTQGYGRQATGCGATVGILPKCDFDCTGCYLGEEANRIKPFGLAVARAQLDELRCYLGPKGNVQITDGEVTLMPPDELVAVIQHATKIGLLPMVMTHGDTFRRRPGLLARLVREGGLREVSIHVDATQRGRKGYKEVRTETGLMPLRQELAEMIRSVRHETGVRLRTATTLTITSENLDEVPQVVDWCFKNRDVFGFMSFQPMAQVGRTLDHLEGIKIDDLWDRVGRALAPYGFDPSRKSIIRYGHPDCTRMEPMAVYTRNGMAPRVMPVLREGSAEDEAILSGYFDHGLGGINFRDDVPLERACRAVGYFLQAPGFFLGPVMRWLKGRTAELGTTPMGFVRDALSRRAKLDSFTVVSHHFMSRDEVHTAAGQERLAACVFRLPVDGKMLPMCQLNAAGVREELYARGSATAEPVLAAN